ITGFTFCLIDTNDLGSTTPDFLANGFCTGASGFTAAGLGAGFAAALGAGFAMCFATGFTVFLAFCIGFFAAGFLAAAFFTGLAAFLPFEGEGLEAFFPPLGRACFLVAMCL